PIAGDYRSATGWIRLHTNAPHHRAAALQVLGVEADRDAVTRAVAGRRAQDLEDAVVAAGGCAAAMRTPEEWARSEPGAAVAGKRSARLDARSPEGRARLVELLTGADVLVSGYRDGALASLGLDRAARDRIRPGLVDVALTAYGWSGPWAGRRGFDSLVQMS